jgi:hypothetical protein
MEKNLQQLQYISLVCDKDFFYRKLKIKLKKMRKKTLDTSEVEAEIGEKLYQTAPLTFIDNKPVNQQHGNIHSSNS